jgi:ACS family tartrate transporter-like MFS transporter
VTILAAKTAPVFTSKPCGTAAAPRKIFGIGSAGTGRQALAEDIERATIRTVAWRLLPLVFLLYLLSLVDRVNLGFAALTMNRDLGLTPYTYSLGVAAFFFGYIPCEVPSNLVLERIGARRWIGRIAITWGLVASGMALVSGERSFLLVRFLLGAAEAGLFPGMLLYLTYWFPRAYRARVNAALVLAIPASGAFGAPVATSLLELNGLFGLAGWKWMFLLEGIPTVVVGFVVLRLLTDRPANATWLAPEGRAWLEATMASERASVEAVHSQLSVWRGLVDLRVLLLCLTYFAYGTISYSMGYFLPLIVKGWGVSNFAVGWIVAVPSVVGIFAMVTGAWFADRVEDKRPFLAALLVVCAIGWIGMGIYATSAWALVAVTLVEIGIGIARPMFWTVPPLFLSGSAMAGAIALISVFANFGGITGPVVIGWLKTTTNSFSGGLYYVACCALASAVAVVLLRTAPRLAGVRGAGR